MTEVSGFQIPINYPTLRKMYVIGGATIQLDTYRVTVPLLEE